MNLSSSSSTSSSSSSSTVTTSWFSGIVRGRSDRSSSLKMANSSAASGAENAGPIKAKNQFRGVLFKYGPKPIQAAFKTGDYKQEVIFIGGLTDGFLATEYLEPLAIALDKEKWSLVQLLLSSSYSGYGTASLRQDAMEIDQLISYLINKENSRTGCQDVVHYMRTNAYQDPLSRFYGVLLCPVNFNHPICGTRINEWLRFTGHNKIPQNWTEKLDSTNAACSRAVRAAILQGDGEWGYKAHTYVMQLESKG